MKLFLFTLISLPIFAQYTYNTANLSTDVAGGGVGFQSSAPKNVNGLVFYAHNTGNGLFQYNRVDLIAGQVAPSVGASHYIGTLFGKVSCVANGTGGVVIGITAIGDIFTMGGDCFVGLHTTKGKFKLMQSFGGERMVSSNSSANGWSLRTTFSVGH